VLSSFLPAYKLNNTPHPETQVPVPLTRLNELMQRTRRPRPIADILPAGPEPYQPDVSTNAERRIRLLVWHATAPNIFGVYRKYLHLPNIAHLPDVDEAPDRNDRMQVDNDQLVSKIDSIIYPFPNISTFRFSHWFYTGSSQKSGAERNRLIESVILAPDFCPEHFRGENMRALDLALDQLNTEGTEDIPGVFSRDGWIAKDIYISIPRGPSASRRHLPSLKSETYDEFGHRICIPGFQYRSLVDVIVSHFTSPSAGPNSFHYIPYRQFWRPTNGQPEERIYDELYTSDAWLEEHDALQRLPTIDGCTLERVIVAMMFSSDATHLAQHGQASLWPVYLTFGNRSKYDRSKVSLRLMEHVAYLVKVSLFL
jgi:hypothetical protein